MNAYYGMWDADSDEAFSQSLKAGVIARAKRAAALNRRRGVSRPDRPVSIGVRFDCIAGTVRKTVRYRG